MRTVGGSSLEPRVVPTVSSPSDVSAISKTSTRASAYPPVGGRTLASLPYRPGSTVHPVREHENVAPGRDHVFGGVSPSAGVGLNYGHVVSERPVSREEMASTGRLVTAGDEHSWYGWGQRPPPMPHPMPQAAFALPPQGVPLGVPVPSYVPPPVMHPPPFFNGGSPVPSYAPPPVMPPGVGPPVFQPHYGEAWLPPRSFGPPMFPHGVDYFLTHGEPPPTGSAPGGVGPPLIPPHYGVPMVPHSDMGPPAKHNLEPPSTMPPMPPPSGDLHRVGMPPPSGDLHRVGMPPPTGDLHWAGMPPPTGDFHRAGMTAPPPFRESHAGPGGHPSAFASPAPHNGAVASGRHPPLNGDGHYSV